MTDGWSSVMKVLLWLFHLDLIPHNIFEMEDFTDSEGVPLPSLSDPIIEENINEQDSTVNALTSWISNAFGSIFTQTPNEIDQTHYLQQQDSDRDDQNDKINQTTKLSNDNSNDIDNKQGNDDNNNLMNQFIDPKCQNIVNSVTECKIGDIFTSSKTYHTNSFVHFARTLISLSNTQCNNTIAATSFLSTTDDECKYPNNNKDGNGDKNNITPSVTTHTITSLDPVPIQTSQLIDNNANNNDKESDLYNSILDEDKRSTKYSNMEDVICLPLTIDMKIFCLERLSQVLSSNINRINEVWSPITDHFQSLIMAQQNNTLKNKERGNQNNNNTESDIIRHSHYFFERISVNILKLCVELTEMETSMIDNVTQFLNLFLSLDDTILFIIGRRVIAGIKLLLNIQSENCKKYLKKQRETSSNYINNYGQCFKQEKDWKIVLFLMKRFANNLSDKQCCLEAFHVIELISKSHLEIINFNYVINVLTIFGKHGIDAPIHNTRVIEIILSIHSRLIFISNNNEIVLGQMWHKTLSNISSFGTNNDYVTRRFAINCLHKALLQYPIKIENKKSFIEPLKLLFQTVLFPLLLQLTKLENDRLNNRQQRGRGEEEQQQQQESDDDNDDLRLKLLTLIFQVWLHDMNILIEYDTNNFANLWFNFLKTIRKFIFMVNQNTNLVTHCCESLKNVILVFQSTNVFDTLSNKTNINVWNETWQILNDCAPNLKQEFLH